LEDLGLEDLHLSLEENLLDKDIIKNMQDQEESSEGDTTIGWYFIISFGSVKNYADNFVKFLTV